ncbi:hypothetical protein [Microtetraspora niveoalba]|uniref:hypothetical protein n=1 Tax=Microtetraspora niveoalba TaxID=46175 RepID=UPI0008360A87|nr:hypothetical protein [Microtetraspora niveoalba]
MNAPSAVAGRPARTLRPRAPGWIVWWLRIAATGHLAGILAQAVLAGLFVTGDVDMLALHRNNGGFTHVLLYLQLVAAILLWRPGRGPRGPAWASAALVGLETAQIALGQSRVLAGHFPLGVTIFGASAVLAVWTWWGLRARERAGEEGNAA